MLTGKGPLLRLVNRILRRPKTSIGRLLWSVVQAPVKGTLGEAAVRAGAAGSLPSGKYHKLHDVTLQTRGGTTHIDYVFVSVFGVFVVETKNMGGWICGSERDKTWAQIFPGGKKIRFMSPFPVYETIIAQH